MNPAIPDLNYIKVFYYVYAYRGFHSASRMMHRSQPSISQKIAKFEAELGQKLFIRRPHARTPFADFFFESVAKPTVEGLAEFMRRMQSQSGPVFRIATSEFIFQHYLVPLLTMIQRDYPTLRVTLRAGTRTEVARWLEEKSIDLAIAVVDQPPAGFKWQPLLPLPVVLLVPSKRRITNVNTLLTGKPERMRMICPPPGEAVCQRFEALLRERKIHWPISVVASSTALVPWIVAAGQGVGVCVGASPLLARAGIRAFPLPGVEPVMVGALWNGEISAPLRALLELIGQTARKIAGTREFKG